MTSDRRPRPPAAPRCGHLPRSVGRLVPALVVLLGLAAAPGAARGQVGGGPVANRHPGPPGGEVYLTRDQAIREVFGDAVRVEADRWSLSAERRKRIRKRAHTDVPASHPFVYRVYDAKDRLLGYAMVVNEKGKYRPITFLVGLKPDGAVRGVEVMVYREDRGYEVRYDRFLRQYRGKGSDDAIRTHRDIMNITGATISVRSLNDGVRRAIATVNLLYGQGGGSSPDPGSVTRGVESWRLTDSS